MKNVLKNGKKALSVFLAVVMMMTTLAVAVPASAVCTEPHVCKVTLDGDVYTYTCVNCGETWTAKVEEDKSPDGSHIHNFGSKTIYQPTCDEKGYTMDVCKTCHIVRFYDYKPALGHSYDEGHHVDATCTTPGGTKYTCTRENCGHSYIDETEPAKGHKFGPWEFAPAEDGDYFIKRKECERCHEYLVDSDENQQANKYYKITYMNPWEANKFEELNNGKTQLAIGYTDKEYSFEYVKEGESAVGPEYYPTRKMDKQYGGYIFRGYTQTSTRDKNNEIVDGGEVLLYNAYHGASINKLTNVTENKTVYASFDPDPTVTHAVTFFNWNGSQLTVTQHVPHGMAAQFPFDNPTREPNVHYTYEFDKWDYDINAIYNDVSVKAVYRSIPQEYTIIYCDWDGSELGRENITYGAPATNVPVINEDQRQPDATYIYSFSGKWEFHKDWGDYVNLDSVAVPEGSKGEVKVYAKYLRHARKYPVVITAVGLNGEDIPGASVMIKDSKGEFVTGGVLNADSKFKIDLTYDNFYEVVVTTDYGMYAGRFELTPPEADGTMNTTNLQLKLNVKDDYNEGNADHCRCICHSMFSRMWISLLNLLNRLFGVKYVCCNDMYAVHGDKLIYTA